MVPRPCEAGSPAELVAMMRKLKALAGLSFRQVEAKAEASGAYLPHSTLVSSLNRTTLPREEILVAFVRACGADDSQVAEWVAARRRLALATATVPESPRRPWWRRNRLRFFLAGALCGVVLCSVATLLGRRPQS